MDTHSPNWLTQTKFMLPPVRDDIVERRRLLDLLHSAVRTHHLTLLSAPAGYGKTTLLASLCAISPDACVAWVSLDEEDNDPARFLATLIAALQRPRPTFGASLYPLLANFSDPANDARRFIGALINETLAHLGETWIVLDDLHLITEPTIFAALDYWLERMPPQTHLIIASRYDPPLVLARLRARGQLAEVRMLDLRFTAEETQSFLNQKQSLGLSSRDLDQLQTRAEGWAAGLRLLAGSLNRIASTADRAAFIQCLAHTEQHIFEFLADEVLRRQEPATRTFLLETSILPELTSALCAAVTGRPDAQTCLDDLAHRNLFLTPVDGGGTTYRYHALFAEFLRAQLKRDHSDRIPELHRRAGDAQKNTERAISHYLAAEAWEDAAHGIESVGEEFMRHGWVKNLRAWIAGLPVSVRDAHPRLLHLAGLCELECGDLSRALSLLESARIGFQAIGDEANLAEVLLLMIDTASRQHDYARQASLTQQALAIRLPVHGQAQLLMAQVWQSLFQCDLKRADSALDQVLQLALACNDLRTFNVMAPILNMHLAFLPGGAARLEHYCREVLARFGNQLGSIQAGTRSLYCYLLFLRGSVDEAAQEAERARKILAQIGGLAYSEAQASGVQGLLSGIHGDYAAQERLWGKGLDQQIPSLQPYEVSSLYFVGRAQWMQGKFDQARQTEARISAIVDPAEFPETAVARKLMRAMVNMADGRYDDAELALAEGVAIERKWPHAVLFGSARAMLAYLHLQCKREKEAWAEFHPLFTECEQKNQGGVILQETKIAIPFLHLAIQRKSHVDFARRLLEILEALGEPRSVSVPDTGETLTPREVVLLRLIATGASNQAIAEQLVISEHTVNSHITSILAKLRVSSRTQAAARARELHLI